MLRNKSISTPNELAWLVNAEAELASCPRITPSPAGTGRSKLNSSWIYFLVFLAFVFISAPPLRSQSTPTSGRNSNVIASQVGGPTVTSISPSSAYRGQSVNVTFSGSNLLGTTAVNGWGPYVSVTNLQATDTKVTATFTLNTQAWIEGHTLHLVGSNGNSNIVTFDVLGPVISSISPGSGNPGQTVSLTFSGSNLSGTTGIVGWGTNATVNNLAASDTMVTATISINSQAADQTYNLSLLTSMGYSNQLSFQVVPRGVPTLSVSPTSLDFGDDPVGTADTLPLTLSSTGTAAVTVSAGSISGAGFSMSGATFPVTLNPGVAITTQVQFDPSTATTDTGNVTFSSNSSTGSTTQVSVSGTGTPAAYKVNLSWMAPTDSSDPVAGYNVYREESGGSSFELLNSSPDTQITFSDSTVQSGTSYSYYVESVDSSGVTSAPSNEITISVP